MKARIIPVEEASRLSDEQKARIIATAYAGPKSYLWRANELKNISYCTDDVKFQVLRESDLISNELYDCIYDIYFGNVRKDDDAPTDTPSDPPTAVETEKRSYSTRMTEEETAELIRLYLSGVKYPKLASIYGRTAAQIAQKIADCKRNKKYKELFKLNEEKATQTTEEKFEEIISSVDAGSKPRSEPKQESAAAPGIPSPNDLPKAFTATGRGFLSTDSGIKLDEEPITTLLRQKIKEKGLAQFYAEVEIIIRPVAPVGMVVNVEE